MEAITRAVNVEALKPWSTVSMRYCSTARACSGVRLLAGEHREVVRGVAEVVARLERLQPLPQAVQRGQDVGTAAAQPAARPAAAASAVRS